MAKGGGRTDGRTDGRTEGRTDDLKFPPVSYRTSALWGRCPKTDTEIDFDHLKKSISNDFKKKSLLLDQSQLCISNGAATRALQRETPICYNAGIAKIEMGNVFTQTNAISN